MSEHRIPGLLLLIAILFGGGLSLAIIVQIVWSRRKKGRRGFPVEHRMHE
jgi:hypothetical protein